MKNNTSPRRLAPRRLILVAVLIGVVAVTVVTAGILTRNHESSALVQWTNAQKTPSVTVIHPTVEEKGDVFSLPGRLEAFQRAPIYARVSGVPQSLVYRHRGASQSGTDLGAH